MLRKRSRKAIRDRVVLGGWGFRYSPRHLEVDGQLHDPTAFTPKKDFRYELNRRLGGLHFWSVPFGVRNISWPFQESNYDSLVVHPIEYSVYKTGYQGLGGQFTIYRNYIQHKCGLTCLEQKQNALFLMHRSYLLKPIKRNIFPYTLYWNCDFMLHMTLHVRDSASNSGP